MSISYSKDILRIPHSFLGSTLNPNVDIFEKLSVSKRRVVTNQRGWRIPPNRSSSTYSSNILLMGCSWAEGVCEDWENTIAGRLEYLTGENIVNIGVASYSPLQAIRRLESEISYINPKIVLFIYPSLTDRLVKLSAIRSIAYRPIFHIQNSDANLIIKESIPIEPDIYNAAWSSAQNIRLGKSSRYDESFLEIVRLYTLFKNQYHRRYISRILGIKRSNIPPIYDIQKRIERDYRKSILKRCFSKLQSLAVSHNFKTVVLPCSHQIITEPQPRVKFDFDFFKQSFPASFDRIFYIDFEHVQKYILSYLRENNLEEWQIVNNIFAPDHNHPNAKGYQLIADIAYKYILESNLYK